MANPVTPFRYPGSKNKFLPEIRKYYPELVESSRGFADVFVGGGSVVLDVAITYPDIHLFINDKDSRISSFWKVVSSDEVTSLVNMLDVKPSISMFNSLRSETPKTDLDLAFHGIFFNRTAFSGILDAGPIGGQSQKGKYTVDCRFNSKVLIKKVMKCHDVLAGRTVVSNDDFKACMTMYDPTVSLFLDPPYYEQGNALYTKGMSGDNHQQLKDRLVKRSKWLLTLDDCDFIRGLYKDCRIDVINAKYLINSKPKYKTELFITPTE
jgi:DNA adenine methylase